MHSSLNPRTSSFFLYFCFLNIIFIQLFPFHIIHHQHPTQHFICCFNQNCSLRFTLRLLTYYQKHFHLVCKVVMILFLPPSKSYYDSVILISVSYLDTQFSQQENSNQIQLHFNLQHSFSIYSSLKIYLRTNMIKLLLTFLVA